MPACCSFRWTACFSSSASAATNMCASTRHGAAGEHFVEKSRGWLSGQHLKVLSAIERCRTAALGGHLDECSDCGRRLPISYNSCRNRHCPKCQANTRERWLQARRKELLPVRYLHSVFTIPHELSALALQNKWVIYSLLLRTSAETLLQEARDPKRLGAEIGFFSILHSWNQKIEHPLAAAGIARVAAVGCGSSNASAPFSCGCVRLRCSRQPLMQPRSPSRATRSLRREALSCAYTSCRSLFPSLQPLYQHQNRSLPRAITAPRMALQPLSRPRKAPGLASGPFAHPIQNA